MSEPSLEEKFKHSMDFVDGAINHLIKLKKEKQELLEFIKLVKDYFDNEDVSIWTEGGTEKHPLSKKANKLIQKYEEGENDR